MDELKTINDLRKHRIDIGCYKNIKVGTTLHQVLDISEGCTIHDLRQNAIKWIKEIEKGFNSEELHIDCNGNKGMLSWIKHFFNITDEDLKE